jgi:hypothetical protein
MIYKNGATIQYPSDANANRLEAMMILGHELAHICLKHLSFEGIETSTDSKLIKDLPREYQATYFSYLMSKRRSDLHKCAKYTEDRWFEDETIKRKTVGLHKGFDTSEFFEHIENKIEKERVDFSKRVDIH